MKTAFLFSGQGAQYPGMMRDLYEEEESVREVFACADKALSRSISDLCFNGTQDDLNLTHNTQPCMLAADLAAGAVLRAKGIEPDVAAGFSLGEYAALVFSGALEMSEAFKIVQLRADAMQDAVAPGDGAMAAIIGTTSEKVEEICAKVTDDYVTPANYNSPVQTVISGTAAGVEKAILLAETEGLHAVRLEVSAPFHCDLMKPAAEALRQRFVSVSFANAGIPVYVNVDGHAYQNAADFPELLVKQAKNPVRWTDTLNAMQQDGIDTFIECGPGKTLSGLVKKTLKGVTILRVENIKTFTETCDYMLR